MRSQSPLLVSLSQRNTSPRKPSVSRRWRNRRNTALGTGLLALLSLVACEKKEEKPQAAPPEVLVSEVVQQDVPIFQEWVAQLNGPVNADITPKVQGYLLKQAYQNGYFVKTGQLLFELDPRQYQAAVEQAKAQVAVAQAKLSEATTNVDRDTPLAAQNAIPQKQLDTDLSNQAAAKAEVLAQKAALQNAELNLAWTKVYSPIDGIAGDAKSQIGDLVGTSTKMATISQVNPIWAYFNISEKDYLGSCGQDFGVNPRRETRQRNGAVHPGGRRRLSAQWEGQPGEPAGCSRHGNHSDHGRVSEPGCHLAARWLRTGTHPDQRQSKRSAGTSAGSDRSAVVVPGDRGDAREQGHVPAGKSGRQGRHELDHHGWLETRRTGRG